ncbi:unnamed protein product [Adineta ricciae]|uniref:EF-hand domain-containing protein n=3 Tax=Adineta ricciae TaxID=249248 RepID=A0A813WRE7_ADIRI|nr:unnamed protein product [Adineta ricciae]
MAVASPRPLIGYDHRQPSPSKKMVLPKIEHPSKRMIDSYRTVLDVRGKSGEGKLIRTDLSSPRQQGRSSTLKSASRCSDCLTDVPENVNAIYGEDRNKVRLPVFGRRPESTTSSITSARKADTPRTSRLIIDELEASLREKVRFQLHAIRAKFRHAAQNDPSGKIDRPALQHLIATIYGTQKQVSPAQIDRLLERLQLKSSNKISFDEFVQALSNGEEDLPNWISREMSSRQEKSSPKKTATQMFLILKEKVRTKDKDLINFCPALGGGKPTRIFKVHFHDALEDMGYKMKDTEFDKLWDKFDTEEFRAISSDKFLKVLFDESIEDGVTSHREAVILKPRSPQLRTIQTSHSDSELKTPRLHSTRGVLDENQVQQWLNRKFPHGYAELEHALERLDAKQTGSLPRERFLEQLKRFGLDLETPLLEYFLKKLNVDLALTNDGIPYQEVINTFKQKSDPTKRRINADNPVHIEETRQAALERQIDTSIAMNYERVENLLNRADGTQSGFVTVNTVRSIIEDLIEYTLRPDEYHEIIKKMPMDDYGRVKYRDYLKQILERTSYLQEGKQRQPKNPKYEFMVSTNVREKVNPKELTQKPYEPERTRTIDELSDFLKNLIRNRSKDIEDEFRKIDRGSYGELTPDLLYNLFRRLYLEPAITRDEVDLIWERCHLKRDGTLDFYQFLREFGYSKQSAHYPNARNHPPKRGDADFILTSNKLYGENILVHTHARNVIRTNWDRLRREFAELDPYRTGYVQPEEFDDVLSELCPAVNQEDLYLIKSKLHTQHDPRMNYMRFLKCYAPLSESSNLMDEPNKNLLQTIDEETPRTGASDRLVYTQVCIKLRRKLSDSYKPLRRSFKQQDKTNSGSVPLKTFKDILNQYQCSLSDEEFYTIASQLDTKLDGSINYNYFLQQYIKNV